MARLNVEDDLYKDARFYNLSVKLGSREAALGALVLAWSIAQKFWKNDKGLIPEEHWKIQSLKNEIIEVGLAKKNEMGIYVCGSEKQFSWLMQKIEAGQKGGKLSAAQRTSKINNLDASVAQAGPSAVNPSSLPLPLPLPLSPSLTTTQSQKKKNKKGEAQKDFAPTEKPNGVPKFCEAWKARYGTNPLINQKSAGQLNSVLKDHGQEKYQKLVDAYLKMPDQWFIKKRHDISTFVSNITTVWHFAETGTMVTNTQLNNFDKNLHHAEILRKIKDGEL